MIFKTFYEEHAKDTYSKYFFHCFLPIFPVLFSCAASNLFQMVIAFDRCMSVMNPVLHRNFLTNRLAKITICAVFAFSILMCSMPMYWNNFPNDRFNACVLLTLTLPYYSYIIVPVFVVILCCLLFIYFQVYRVATKNLRDNVRTLKMVAVILTSHAVCWSPHMVCTYFLLNDALPKKNQSVGYHNLELYTLYHWLLLLALSSSFLNALLYSWRMPDFRKAINEIIYRKKPVIAVYFVKEGDVSSKHYSQSLNYS
ncbi:beta-1 adrenergic receptor-like [Cloeon dipterum]|uniref:beta-1 adrenergic receptor-like n=1 Tax=Cloeon dipterum TaxID=197152 RepID=UPI00321FA2AE